MKPTPEDIEVATLIEHVAWCPAHLDIKAAAQLIADHTTQLRELAEIGRLAVEAFRDEQVELGESTPTKIERAIDAYLAKHPTP